MKAPRNLILLLSLAACSLLAPASASAGLGSKPQLAQKKSKPEAGATERLSKRELASLVGKRTLTGGLKRVDANANGPSDGRHNFRFSRQVSPQVTYDLHIVRDGGKETVREHKILDTRNGAYIILDQAPDGRIKSIGANLLFDSLVKQAVPVIKGMMPAEMKQLLRPYALMIPHYED